MKKIILPLMSLLFLSSVSFADQAVYVTKAQAKSAKALVEQASVVQSYCALCDGDVPTVVYIETVRVHKIANSDYELLINDEPVDLAYLYVDGKNVGLQLKVEDIHDVPAEIQVQEEQ